MHRRLWLFLGLATALLASFPAAPALGQLTPDSPEVHATIDRGIHWLESASDSRVGAKALVGLVMLKRGLPSNHPKIVEAVTAIQQLTQGSAAQRSASDVYSLGLSVIFLATLDPSQYRADIDTLLQTFQTIQKPHGGFGYSNHPTGDTSMTQYIVLAMWEAREAGVDFPTSMAENVLEWLLRTQDPSGAFGYQGKVASSPTSLEEQSDVRPSLATAGLGSVYVCADLLGLGKSVSKKKTLPPALKEVRKLERKPVSHIEPRLVEAAKARGNQWLQAHYDIEKTLRVHYFLYALERYWSFREAAEGPSSHYPAWYHDGATFLLRAQRDDGSWAGEFAQTGAHNPSVPDTAFSLLFLLRSMKKSIEHTRGFGAGLLVGGKGLPHGSAAVELRGGQLVAKPLSGPAQGLLAAMGNVDSSEFDQALEALGGLPTEQARSLVSQNAPQLRELLTSGHPDARLAIVRALGNSDDLGQVPTLIYALQDPEAAVVVAARDALRRLSRRLDTGGMPDDFSEEQRRVAIEQWKRWYLALQPDAVLED